VHGFREVREPSKANQLGESAYRFDEGYFMTERVEWAPLMATLDRFGQEVGQFFRLCLTDHLHQAMAPKAA
jgi:hypothetical protein